MRDTKVLDSFKKQAEKKLKEMNIFKYLKKECLTRNASIIYATHIFDNLEKYITNVVFISNKTCDQDLSFLES